MVRSLVDLVRLTAYADDLAMVLANMKSDLPRIVEEVARWAKASGLALNVAKCVVVQLWCCSDGVLVAWIRECCSCLAGCVGGARAIHGGGVGLGAWDRQWRGFISKMLRCDAASAGETLSTRLVQFKVYVTSLVLYRAQFCALDWRVCEARRQAVQRLCGLSSLGFASEACDMHPAADAAWLRASSESLVFARCRGEIAEFSEREDAMIGWPGRALRMQGLRTRHVGDPTVDVALTRPRAQSAFTGLLAHAVCRGCCCGSPSEGVSQGGGRRGRAGCGLANLVCRRRDVLDAVKIGVLHAVVN